MKRQREEETQSVVLVGKKQTKTKRVSQDFNLKFHNTPVPTKTSGKILFPFVLQAEKSISIMDVLALQRLGCNLPGDGWSLPKAKIISALTHINMVTIKSLIMNAVEDVSTKNS